MEVKGIQKEEGEREVAGMFTLTALKTTGSYYLCFTEEERGSEGLGPLPRGLMAPGLRSRLRFRGAQGSCSPHHARLSPTGRLRGSHSALLGDRGKAWGHIEADFQEAVASGDDVLRDSLSSLGMSPPPLCKRG